MNKVLIITLIILFSSNVEAKLFPCWKNILLTIVKRDYESMLYKAWSFERKKEYHKAAEIYRKLGELEEEFSMYMHANDYQKALDITLRVADDYKSALLAGELGQYDDARRYIQRLPPITAKEKSMIKVIGNSAEVQKIVADLELALRVGFGKGNSPRFNNTFNLHPLFFHKFFDPTSKVICRGNCIENSSIIKASMKVLGYNFKNSMNKNHLSLILNNNIIIDPAIHQYLNHPDMQGIFIGTKEELKRWVNDHPQSIIGTRSSKKPEEFLRRTYGIE